MTAAKTRAHTFDGFQSCCRRRVERIDGNEGVSCKRVILSHFKASFHDFHHFNPQTNKIVGQDGSQEDRGQRSR